MQFVRLPIACLWLIPALVACGGAAEPSAAPETSRPAGNAMTAAGLTFELPSSWQSETPSSGMRFAQATIPGSAGPGQLTAFFFGPGGGGGVEENLQRWIAQVELEPGQEAARESFEQGDLRVSWVDLSGTLKASQIGSFPATDQPGYRLFAAVIEGGGGPWFFRAVAPAATLAEQRAAFEGMLKSARRGGG